VVIGVTTDKAITVGSTDVVLVFDPAVLQATAVSSSSLSGFEYTIANVTGQVRTRSAANAGNRLVVGAQLFAVTFTIKAGAAPGPSALTISDSTGPPLDGLRGVSPPVPVPSIPYTVEAGQVLVIDYPAGDVECSRTPISPADAGAILCRFVGRCRDAIFPVPCSDPTTRLRLSDWDCSGTLTPADAAVTLAIVVHRIRIEDTPWYSPGCHAAAVPNDGGGS